MVDTLLSYKVPKQSVKLALFPTIAADQDNLDS